jgi:hypothetical protein
MVEQLATACVNGEQSAKVFSSPRMDRSTFWHEDF